VEVVVTSGFRVLSRGDNSAQARELQEWLCLNKKAPAVKVDGDYGKATELAVCVFQRAVGLEDTGIVDEATWWRLREALTLATVRIDPYEDSSLGRAMVLAASLHLDAGARELGGKNLGPWVRLYNGADGPDQAWCAGMATYVMNQAADWLKRTPPIPGSVSCDRLAQQAIDSDLFNSTPVPSPGDLFLVRGAKRGDWVHTGIVKCTDGGVFVSIEGNSNDAGAREGLEVCQRVRPIAGLDFVNIGNA
jgi:hypothetical protein